MTPGKLTGTTDNVNVKASAEFIVEPVCEGIPLPSPSPDLNPLANIPKSGH